MAESHQVQVLRLVDLTGPDAPPRTQTTLVIDVTGPATPSLAALARLVLVRHRLRAAGGDLALVADDETTDLLARSGLNRSLPAYPSREAATEALEHSGT